MNWLKKLAILFTFSFFLSCGIQESYYLPQVPDNNIRKIDNTAAVLNIPSINSYYFSRGYRIFYRIYISNFTTTASIISDTDRSNISPTLASDYNILWPVADPVNTTSITNANTFISRSYFELQLEGTNDISEVLTSAGGTVNIDFLQITGTHPVLTINGKSYNLRRSTGEGTRTFSPVPEDRYFFSTPVELNAFENAVSDINGDVAGRSGESENAYVSMYIVAWGSDPTSFNPVYSKPTHINIFRLPFKN
ncbi:MAG: hypothetical protein LBQ89_04015 [Treponema sp.]|jgi:hypothetical protein|nr:hypothetical protein [Treponema sp.]